MGVGTKIHLWLRHETNPLERRTPLMPQDAALLLEAGFKVTVERSRLRIYSDERYSAVGCELTSSTWREAPRDAFILGVKELPNDDSPLIHRHLYFAHALKQQNGSAELLARFSKGGGTLFDLEYLRNAEGERLVAFGFWAGFVGAALAAIAWSRQRVLPEYYPSLSALQPFPSSKGLLAKTERKLAKAMLHADRAPQALVIGAAGRCGRGAIDAFRALGIEVTPWTRRETQNRRGPYPEIVDYEILVNCVGLERPLAPFLTLSLIQSLPCALSVISDVTCDVGNSCHALPLYDQMTTLTAPVHRILGNEKPLDVIALDRLPSLLPLESSSDFSGQLTPLLLRLQNGNDPIWRGAEAMFQTTALASRG